MGKNSYSFSRYIIRVKFKHSLKQFLRLNSNCMKQKLTDELKEILAQSKDWVKLEVEYVKLTAAEKLTVLISALVIGAVCLLLGTVALMMFSFALAELFDMFMPRALAFVATGGVVLLLTLCFYLLRKPLLLNPIARLISRLIITKN